eukprot:TRINITY_DN8184_c0_g1_i1.p2 TRINITY_DN8184_c0_g1~~TRINITY_DN8184_c0_g1_i1.p2  ORF type:complete len:131 (-),score=40.34 TRINITY_DN8184_c0_g1_i1:192-584(-)
MTDLVYLQVHVLKFLFSDDTVIGAVRYRGDVGVCASVSLKRAVSLAASVVNVAPHKAQLWYVDEIDEVTLLNEPDASLVDLGMGLGGRVALAELADPHYCNAMKCRFGCAPTALPPGASFRLNSPISLLQ